MAAPTDSDVTRSYGVDTSPLSGSSILCHRSDGVTSAVSLDDLRTFMRGTLLSQIAGISPAAGEMLYYNGTAWVALAPGSEGQTLTFTGGVPTWV